MGGQELFHHFAVLFRFQAAGAVHQDAVGFRSQGGVVEQLQLRRMQPVDFLRA